MSLTYVQTLDEAIDVMVLVISALSYSQQQSDNVVVVVSHNNHSGKYKSQITKVYPPHTMPT